MKNSTNNGTKVNNGVNFDSLTEAQKNAVLKMLASNDKKQKEEFTKLEKIAVKESYKGILNIFNLIRKESSFESIKGKDFEKFGVIGSMNFNQFCAQFRAVGAYSFDNVWNFIKTYDRANDGDKVLILERGVKINTLLMELKSGKITQAEALKGFVSVMGLPTKTNKKGEISVTVSESTVKILFSVAPELYEVLNLSLKFPILHDSLINPIEEGVQTCTP